MIIGVSLVVDDLQKGQKLVFRYPEALPSVILDSANDALIGLYMDYLNFKPDNFAKLFRPQAGLFNKVLDLVIDDLHYISYPCPCANYEDENEENNISLFNVVITKVRDSAMRRILKDVGMSSGTEKKSGSGYRRVMRRCHGTRKR